jgi:hypothetical protein
MTLRLLPALLCLALLPGSAAADILRYRGALTDAGVAAEGTYALRLGLFDAPHAGRRIGEEVTLADIEVHEGRLATDVDFGLSTAAMDRLWLQVEVAGPEGVFEPVGARQSLDAKALATNACWSTAGNAGTDAARDFLGTLDAQPLVLRANNVPVLRLAATSGGPNVIGGAAANLVDADVKGATIAGGGDTAALANAVHDDYGAIGGGADNSVGVALAGSNRASYSTIAGGAGNTTSGHSAAIGGGNGNQVDGFYATVPGGLNNFAGGTASFAAGQRAWVRGAVQIGAVPASTDTLQGDVGSFVWNGATGTEPFVSSGAGQFLLQIPGGAGINTNAPRAPLHVRHPSGTALAATPDSGTALLAEKSGGNSFITVLGAVGAQRGILFAEPGEPADGGITYDNFGLNGMEFRTNGNVKRLSIAQNGNVFVESGLYVFGQAYKAGGGPWEVLSDARLKRNVSPLSGALARLLALRGVNYEYAEHDELRPPGVHTGFLAQEVREVFPEWVHAGADGLLSVGPRGFEALTVEAFRELAEENATLQADNASLARAHAELQSAQHALARRLARLEAAAARRER